jgi:putative peptidoglycan lipid II flippase
MQNPPRSASYQVAKAASTVMIAFVMSSLTGLLRQILVARAFGTGTDMEAFNAANRVSETLFNLVAGGALASAFIPTFSGLLVKGEHEKAWRLASAIANLVLLILGLLGFLSWWLAPQIVRYVLAPGFALNPLKEAQTIHLLRLMLPSAILFSLSGLVMGILNSHQIFFIPALTPSMYQIGMIFGVLLLSPKMGIDGLAWGVVIGSAFHLGLQLPALLRLKGRYFRELGFQMPEVREVFRLFAPRLIGVAVVQLNFWVNTRIASTLPEGSVTGVVLAFTLMLMPQAAIAQSVAIAALPTLSSQFALGKMDEFRSTLVSSLRGILMLAIPASIGLMVLRQPIIILLYQRGAFTAHSTQLVAWALLWYAAGLVGHCIVEILARAFYAMHDTRTPVLVGTVAMGLNVILSFLFSNWFLNLGWMPHGGLALANSVATALEMLGLILLMRYKIGGLEGRSLLIAIIQATVASIGMLVVLFWWMGVTIHRHAALVTLGGIVFGAFVYLGLGWIFGNREIRSGFILLKQKITAR